MTFSETLNHYALQIGCSNKELASAADISAGAISRYRNGERTPAPESDALLRLAHGIFELAKQQGLAFSEAQVLTELKNTIRGTLNISYEAYLSNLNRLIRAFKINNNELARHLNYDPSYISRVLSGQRRPSNIERFSAGIARYAASLCSNESDRSILSELVSADPERLIDESDRIHQIALWLGTDNTLDAAEPVSQFLEKLDAFDLNEYIQAVHFDAIKVPSVPFQMPSHKVYSGIQEMMEAEIDFIKRVVLSKSMDDVIIYSDMPIESMSKDPEFPKKYLYGMAVMLKKGLHIHFIHDVNRPLDEMFLGLEGYIPLYMTGQISPYYLRASQSQNFLHLIKTSGTAAMHGEAIVGHHAEGRYRVTNNKEEVRYYKARAAQLLSNALPLMQIYRSDRSTEFMEQFRRFWAAGNRKMFLSGLPLFTLSEELLTSMLARHKLPAEDVRTISRFYHEYRQLVQALLQKNSISIVAPATPSREAFDLHPSLLSLPELFYRRELPYRYDEYVQHLSLTRAFAKSHANFIFDESETPSFQNINIHVLEGSCVLVSKSKSPQIHFIIRHPGMVRAFETFSLPLKDEEGL